MMNKVVGLSLCLIASLALADEVQKENEEDIVFDSLDISATEIKKEEKSFTTPGAVSARDNLRDSTQSVDSIVRSMPGSYTNTDQSQGTIQVNLRGTTGFGRVNTTIDGVTQTFFGTSTDSGKFHTGQGSLGTSVFGAPIDQNFLTSVEIEKGSFSGGHGGLMGSAHFKTIDVDDLVRKDSFFGFLTRYSYGTNGLGPSYMAGVAAKTSFKDNASIGALFAYSGKKISQDYKIGGGGKISDQNFEDSFGKNDVSPFDPKDLTQRPKGYLFKIDSDINEENRAKITYRRYENSLAGRDMLNDTYQFDYRYNPISYLLDTKLLLAYNKGDQKYNDDATLFANSAIFKDGDLEGKNNALTFDLSNTMNFKINDLSKFALTLGFNHLANKYKNTLKQKEKAGYDINAIPFQPKGQQKISTLYLDTTYEYDIFALDTNLNLSKWLLKGHKPECYDNPNCFPREAADVKNDDTNFNASIMLSANINDLFSPFVSYTKSTRPPNIQEMFFSDNFGDSINPFLDAEKAQTYQIGFNSFKHNFFKDSDRFGFKILYYKTYVDDFIYNKSFYNDKAHRWTLHLNSQDKVEFYGVESELSYDTGFFYTKASYSYETSKQPINETYGNDMFGFGKIAELPKDYAILDLGFRFLDEKLTVGTFIKYTGNAKRVHTLSTDTGRVGDEVDWLSERDSQKLPQIPTILDFYSSYKPMKNLSLKFEIQNAFDKNYQDALNAFNSAEPELLDENENNLYAFSNSARGRSFIFSFEYRY